MRRHLGAILLALVTSLGGLAHAGDHGGDYKSKYSEHEPKPDFKPTHKTAIRMSKKIATRLGKKYGLSAEQTAEQELATAEAIERIFSDEAHKVTDQYKYKPKFFKVPVGSTRKAVVIRSNQPAPENLVEIGKGAARVGVKPEEIAIVNLRYENNVEGTYMKAAAEHDDSDVRNISKFRAVHLKIIDHTIPTMDQVKHVLELASDPSIKVMVLHCKAGVARTGMMMAAIRIALDGWSVSEAIAEAREYKLGREVQIRFLQDFAQQWKAGAIKLGTKAKS